MSQRVVTNPKVFISYSWTTPEHEEWVVDLGRRLREDGIDVILDKWDLKEGQDTHFFMESMVASDRVLVICDSGYKEKANQRSGGVGTEAQIITPEVYSDVKQQKFIPIVSERDIQGNHYIPKFIATRLYIDLSSHDAYEEQYEILIRAIYEKPLHQKPALGNAPSFLFQEHETHLKTSSVLRTMKSSAEKYPNRLKYLWNDFVENYIETMMDFQIEILEQEQQMDDVVVEKLEQMVELRDEYVAAMELMVSNEVLEEGHITDFYEKVYFFTESQGSGAYHSFQFDHYKFLITELFLYTVAILVRERQYGKLAGILNADYFLSGRNRTNDNRPSDFSSFKMYPESFNYRNERLNLRRTSIIADLLVKRANHKYVNDLISADIILYNISKLLNEETWGLWYPSTYIYLREKAVTVKLFLRLKSKNHYNNIKILFNNMSEEEFKTKAKEMRLDINDAAWNAPPLIKSFVSPEEICSKV